MSAYSTLKITRIKAKELLVKKILGDISDDSLEEFMDELLSPQLYNCVIVPDHHEENDNHLV